MENAVQPLHVLRFNTVGHFFCLPVEQVECVIPLPEWQPIQNPEKHTKGLINYHGQLLPLLDLSIRLQLRDHNQYTLNTPAIICNYQTERLALIVDEILNTLTLMPQSLSAVGSQPFSNDQFIQSAYFYDNQTLYLLNLAAIAPVGHNYG